MFKPLFCDDVAVLQADWDTGAAKWDEGLVDDYHGSWKARDSTFKSDTYEEWTGGRPDPADYMPQWTAEEKTHYMMYETCTEGTPISPAFASPEELAHWLADNKASAFAYEGASYESWLRVCQGGFAPSAVMADGKLTSGVESL
jgi:putative sterol carrier protein